jgi:hypothetical protein
MRSFTRRLFATFGAFALTASAVSAQEIAGNFDQLRVLVKSSDSIGVRDTQGQEVRGRLLDLSAGSIAILSDGVRREFAASDVDTITASRHGNLATGAKWGLGTGAGLGALLMLTNMPHGRCYDCGVFFAVVTSELAGIGAGIGVGVSALTTSQRVIFARSGEHRTTLSLAPVVDRDRKGIMLTARW